MTETELIESRIRVEGNAAIARTSSLVAFLGLLAVGTISIMLAFAEHESLVVPAWACGLGSAASYLVYRLAKAELIHGRLALVVFPLYASMPTFAFVAAAILLEGGVAVFLTGPLSYLYCPLILVSACLFDPRYPDHGGHLGGSFIFRVCVLRFTGVRGRGNFVSRPKERFV